MTKPQSKGNKVDVLVLCLERSLKSIYALLKSRPVGQDWLTNTGQWLSVRSVGLVFWFTVLSTAIYFAIYSKTKVNEIAVVWKELCSVRSLDFVLICYCIGYNFKWKQISISSPETKHECSKLHPHGTRRKSGRISKSTILAFSKSTKLEGLGPQKLRDTILGRFNIW